MANISTYRASIRQAIRGYWSGKLSQSDFLEAMRSAINRGLTQAWLAGAKECADSINDLTPPERAKLAGFIVEQQGFIGGIAQAITVADKAQGGKLGDVMYRADLWANKWDEVKATAEAMCRGDEKREFVLGPTKEKCRSCLGLAGRVYRYSVWLANGAIPPTHRTQCKGYRCLCRLMPTTKPLTRGKFPRGLLTA
jgi:hypothetical protein